MLASFIANVLEDGYVEARVLNQFTGVLGCSLEEMRQAQYEDMPTVEELIEKEDIPMNIQIYPLDKVTFDNVSIRLGMEKAAVELALGAGEAIGNRYYYFNSEMAIDYRVNKVDFIEFLGGVDGKLKPAIYGVSVFDTNAAELVAVLKKNNSGEIWDDENGYSYQFSNISIGVYREAIPDEITEMIEEAKSYGNPMSDEDIHYEMKRANYWATIGCGTVGYYQR